MCRPTVKLKNKIYLFLRQMDKTATFISIQNPTSYCQPVYTYFSNPKRLHFFNYNDIQILICFIFTQNILNPRNWKQLDSD